MQKAKSFIKTTVLGGLVVILPVTIILVVFRWLYLKVTDLIQPLTNLLLAKSEMREFYADLIVIFIIVCFCFFIGLAIKTSLGRFVYDKLETKLLSIAPGYNMVKETILQFLGRKKSPFSSVALVQIFQNDTMATAFITEEHEDGSYTVFVPTGPNPTSGQIFHMARKYVHPLEVGIDETMRSIISCGVGSNNLISAFKKNENCS
ncbi:MAG: DUF502 domain-containing protein [Proteobacteria bacterium]|nr:DUF502 domain-containing protein [Pseudomonadota bacterium]